MTWPRAETRPKALVTNTEFGAAKEGMVTVEEVIAILQELPSDLRVVVNGYEDGYDDLTPEQFMRVKIGLNIGKNDYEGVHGDPADAKDAEVVEAVVLLRTSN